ncbi:MAG: EFR1 family ferrodoxin [Eubacteriales bacterium]|nr:EFR1 family ferrodoxin [Eubacteriales bacterium]
MILFFSGTGNSKYVAQRLAAGLEEQLVDLNDRIKNHNSEAIEVDGKLVVVTPTYAWRIPHVVSDFLRKTELKGVSQVWYVMTCGDSNGNAERYNRKLSSDKGFIHMGTAKVIMPENYLALFAVPDVKEAKAIIARAEPEIDHLIQIIAAGRLFSLPHTGFMDGFYSNIVNPLFYPVVVKAKAFYAKPNCIGCGKCVSVCPLNNVSLVDKRPVWGKNCTHCMACICHCPVEAIEYGNKTAGKPRYHLEKCLPLEKE